MAAFTEANWDTAWGQTASSSTITTVGLPIYKTGDVVYDNRQYTNTSGAGNPYIKNPYTVIGLCQKSAQFSGAAKLLQSDLATAATSSTGTQSDATVPIFYIIQNNGTGAITPFVHQKYLILLAAVETLVGTDITTNW